MEQEIAEGLAVATSHPASHLVEVGETEILRTIDDDGIGVGDVDTVFYDSSRKQYVIVVV